MSLQVSDFRGTDGRIAAENFRLFEVGYVPVKTPTDKFGWADDWPDPLPPLEGPVHCVAGRNQPFWLLAYVPPDTPAGKYRGRVTVTAGDVRALVPVQLRVWDFTLTPETHTRTAYGVSPDFAFLGVRDRDQQRQVYDLYMQSCRDHRISPYSPMRFYPMDIQLHAPSLKLTCGRLAIEFERGQQHPWKLFWDGEQIATQRTSMTHFEKEGVGWKGTGVSWPYVDAIESVHEVSTTDDMQVLDVVAAHTTSGAAARSFRLTFRFFVPAGDDWFAMRLLQMESTDPTEIEVRNYYNIPRTTFKAESVANGPGFAAWSGDGVGFGMLCLAGNVGGLSIEPGAQGVTVSNSVEPFRIKNGQRHDGWGPLVVYFVTTNTSAEGLAARAAALRQRIDPANPTAYVPSQPVSIAVERRDDYTFTHDFAEFDKGASRYLDEFHFNGFNMRCMPGSIGGHKRFTPEYKRLHRLMYRPVIEHLREKGWLKYAYSYWFDEPSKEDYPHVIEGMKLLGDNCPGLTRLLTEQPEPELEGVIDLWVPVLSMYRPDRCQQRQAAGDQVWWYVCTGPRAPYPNNFVDHPALNHRIRFWMAEKYGVTGSLYWSTTFYGKTPDGQFRNPYLDGMTYRPGGGYWGNGDGMLLYPACTERSNTPVIKGPVVSLRWETLRDGIEDREYFWTLRQEAARLQRLKPKASREKRRDIARALDQAANALGSPDRLADSLIEFDKDPQGLLRERERLARAIEACRRIR
ncbi:MAG: glycoside hydrolase domain-containing protein [Armatimonadota bacterium]